mmetsp:Transcript_19998/g.75534  ORF Transcript_19998/g.75534 Transcript_19998/m.75534 type:complete len:1039 (-) Transcript_19998:221-3337(-)
MDDQGEPLGWRRHCRPARRLGPPGREQRPPRPPNAVYVPPAGPNPWQARRQARQAPLLRGGPTPQDAEARLQVRRRGWNNTQRVFGDPGLRAGQETKETSPSAPKPALESRGKRKEVSVFDILTVSAKRDRRPKRREGGIRPGRSAEHRVGGVQKPRKTKRQLSKLKKAVLKDRLAAWFLKVSACTADTWSVVILELCLPKASLDSIRGQGASRQDEELKFVVNWQQRLNDAYRDAIQRSLALGTMVSVQRESSELLQGVKRPGGESSSQETDRSTETDTAMTIFLEYGSTESACKAAANLDGQPFGSGNVFGRAGVFPLRLYRRRRLDASLALWPARLPAYLSVGSPAKKREDHPADEEHKMETTEAAVDKPQAEEKAVAPQQQAEAEQSAPHRCLVIFDLVSAEDIEDPEEEEEIIMDIRELGSTFGKCDVRILPIKAEDEAGDSAGTSEYALLLNYEREEESERAARVLHGEIFGGRPIQALLYPCRRGVVDPCVWRSWAFKWDEKLKHTASALADRSASDANPPSDASLPSEVPESSVVCIPDMVRIEEVVDDDEYEEIVFDLRELAGRIAPEHQARVEVKRAADAHDATMNISDGFVAVFLDFHNPLIAAEANRALSGMIFAGATIHPFLLPSPLAIVRSGEASSNHQDDGAHDAMQIDEQDPHPENSSTSTVQLLKMVTEEEIEDEDERGEIELDLRELGSGYGLVKDIAFVRREDTEGVVVEIVYGDHAQATSAARGLDGRVFGGQAVSAVVKEAVAAPTAQGSTSEMDARPSSAADPQAVDATVSERLWTDDEDLPAVIGPELLAVIARPIRVPANAARDGKRGEHGGSPGDAAHGDPSNPADVLSYTPQAYQSHRQVPNLTRQSPEAPRVPTGSQSPQYAPVFGGEEYDARIKAMLSTLQELQDRAKHRGNEFKAKRGRRLIVGIKEVKKHIPRGKLRILVLANNIDVNGGEGAMFDAVNELIELAMEHNVLITYSLGKRPLGKAVGRKIKVSAVAVCNVDGANEIFNAVEAEARELGAKHGLLPRTYS